MTGDDVVRAIEEVQAQIDEGEGENSGVAATAARYGIDWDQAFDSIEELLWNDRRHAIESDHFDPDGEGERMTIGQLREQARSQAHLMLGAVLAGLHLACKLDS